MFGLQQPQQQQQQQLQQQHQLHQQLQLQQLQQQQQQQQQLHQQSSGWNSHLSQNSHQTAPVSHPSLSQSIWQPANRASTEKAASEQMQVLVEKWMSESANCSFQHYFYNSVPADHVPYYTPPNGEDAKKWEEALASKPFEGSIPVLAKGFPSLAQRLGTQVRAVAALQARLHEMNDSLTALLNNHDLSISTRTLEAKRKQVGLSQRCLSLAAKVQILRNKGYMMDSAEDNLSKRLLQLQFDSFDPVLKGRTEQIWAKLIDIREVMRIAQQNAGSNKGNGEDKVFPLDEDTLRIAKEVLHDYDRQLATLAKELDIINKDYKAWSSPVINQNAK